MRNRARKGAIHTQTRKFTDAVRQSSDIDAVENQFRLLQKNLDKTAARGTLHKNTVSRRKSRLARQLNAAKAKAAAG